MSIGQRLKQAAAARADWLGAAEKTSGQRVVVVGAGLQGCGTDFACCKAETHVRIFSLLPRFFYIGLFLVCFFFYLALALRYVYVIPHVRGPQNLATKGTMLRVVG